MKGEVTKQRILDATIEAAEQYGFYGFHTGHVKLKTNMASNTLRYHFRTIDILRAALREEILKTKNISLLVQFAALNVKGIPMILKLEALHQLKTRILTK